MNNKYDIDPAFKSLPSINLSFKGWIVALLNIIMKLTRWIGNSKYNVEIRHQSIPRADGGDLRIIKFTPPGVTRPMPCLLYCHGGGFALTYCRPHISMVQRYASEAGCCVVFVDYRLMPADPFPAGQEDCYTALQWIFSNADSLGIDTDRVAVMGDSAGGALSASVCQMNKDRSTTAICAQLLIYPVIDMDCKTPSARDYINTPIFTSKSNRAMWQVYLSDCTPGVIPDYASPIHRKDLCGLPSAYIETAEFDPLHDEGVNYAEGLRKAGVEVSLNDTRRTVHGYDAAGKSQPGEESMQRRIEFLKLTFHKKGSE